MKDRERAQIRRILDHAAGLFRQSLNQRLQAVYSTHSLAGRLQSGATIKVAVGEMAEGVGMMLEMLDRKVRAVSAEPAAFALLAKTINQLLDVCATELPKVIDMACGRSESSKYPSVEEAANALYDDMRADFVARLEILSFDYERAVEVESVAATVAVSNKAGRPPADFWDDMWAFIAASLYQGDLAPRTQAELERAMTDWIEGRGRTAAVSTVRARARRLWDLLALGTE